MTLNEIVRACRGSFGYPADVEIKGISTDSRTVKADEVFIALKGENFDGHDFAAQAAEKGAAAVICQRPVQGARCIIVDSTKQALLEIAALYRKKFSVRLAAVTGSVGKTTVTEMLWKILSLEGKTLKTEENRHNEIGLPVTLFRLDSSYKNAVVEMGITQSKGISALSAAAAPDVCVITNIGHAHFEGYNSLEGILKAKMEILDGASCAAPLILNGDDKMLSTVDLMGMREVLSYSVKDKSAPFHAESVKTVDERLEFNIVYPRGKMPVRLNCMGTHNVSNALAAFAAAYAMGAEPEKIREGLESYTPDGYRQQFINTKACRVLADLGNFSPQAVKAAAEIIKNCKTGEKGRRIAVLSDMTALGKKSASLHKTIGEALEKCGIDLLYCIDERAGGYIIGATKKGLPEQNARLFSSKEELAKALKETVRAEDVVLLKCRKEYAPFEILKELDR